MVSNRDKQMTDDEDIHTLIILALTQQLYYHIQQTLHTKKATSFPLLP